MTKQASVGFIVFILAIVLGPIIYLHTFKIGSISAASKDLTTSAGPQYQVVDLGILPGANWSEANSVNDKGQVLCTSGTRTLNQPSITNSRAFLWENGQQRNLGMLAPYPISRGIAINNLSQALGITSKSDANSSGTLIFLWQNGKMRNLGTLSLLGREPHALSNQTDIIGEALPAKQTAAKTAFIWQSGKSRYLGLPDPSSANAVVHGKAKDPLVIVGELQGNGFLWRNGKLVKLWVAGAGGSQLRAVNTSGQSVGCVDLATGHAHALLWHNGKTTDLGALGLHQDSIATAINDSEMIVGFSTTAPDNVMHAVLWKGNVIHDLNAEIGSNPGMILSSAKGINNHNQIICDGILTSDYSSQYQHAFLLTPR